MRDRGTTLVTILVVLCCIGGTVKTRTLVSHRVFVAAVTSTNPMRIVEICSNLSDEDTETVKTSYEIDGDLQLHADIVEHHNLPPPFQV